MNPGTILGALASGRLAGDDLPDVAVADISHRRVEILRNLGNGQLQRQLGQGFHCPFPTEPTSVAIADFNRDGLNDVAIAAYGDTS